jgi:hypothetical protein
VLDCESRSNAARFFLSSARNTSVDDVPQYTWYIQASVIFAMAVVDNLMYDFAEKFANQTFKDQKMYLSDFIERFDSDTDFYRWLKGYVAKLNRNPLYRFLREQRNRVEHRGQDKKRVEAKSMYFKGWNDDPADKACELVVGLAEQLIDDAKRRYPNYLLDSS